ncbi:two-component system sensor histidine kinase YesM [Paenibacillus sp. PastF-3]|uniref:sensor histidine kinase n=1 Tax=Paenibacillus TaxID=44249 RepID=UPI000B9FB973|nr:MULTISPECIES: sensor histidine kinase [unclassified Paenibacillus]MDH6368541.1 two-component system sensor histidine kinase YesM [Paenibacillus sp. PastF-3]OZQ96819.1 two-component sensor histidine kinase [Paenibacillus sp. VTT E-133291]
MKMRRRHKYVPIGYKLMLTYMFFIIIPISLIGFVSHSMYNDSLREHINTNIKGTLLQIRDNIDYKMDEVTRISTQLYSDFDFYRNLRSYEEGWENYDRMSKKVLPKLDVAIQSTGVKIGMSLFLKNESIPEIYSNSLEGYLDNSSFYHLYHMKRIEGKSWYYDFPTEKYAETMKWWQIESDVENNRISLLRRLIDTYEPLKPKEIGFLRINVRIPDLFDSVSYTKIGKGSNLIIKNEFGRTMYQSGELPENYTNEAELNKDYLTIKETIMVANQAWQLIALVPIAILEKDAMKVRLFIILMCLICCVVFSFVGIFISRYFSIRINKFVYVLNAYREGDLHKRIKYRGKDEFSQIATALNDMGENIDMLIKEVYLTQLQKKEAELEILQSQINPHFLYNTLSSIIQLAKFGQNEKLQKMVLELAKFYRLTLNEGRTMIPVPTEIEQANAYLEIQKIKYGDRLEVMFDFDTEIWPYETIKLILQPFIENVLKHAWCGDHIHLRIVGRKEGDSILFRIIDDGIGIRQERIDQIFDSKGHTNTGYGVRNVDQRIKLQYGPEYGVTIFSRVGIGTSVQILIPAKKRK